jgi:hypothetical protein
MGGSLFGSKSKSSSTSKSEQWSKPVVIPMNDYYPQYLQDALQNFFAQDYPTRATINYGGQSFTVPANSHMADRMAQYMQLWKPTVAQESYGWSNATNNQSQGSPGIFSAVLGTIPTVSKLF